jgi:hypothetical protein
MARAPNPGAPQRVSAHVVPKAAPFSADDEEEKTTIESGGWEEEASTTVEQGDVADKLRALALGAPPVGPSAGVDAIAGAARPNTNITSTDGSGVDEPTIDDQRANLALLLIPAPSSARLVVTAGGDSGRVLEVRPGKTYTIGRGIDNDLVLTDITASRKHFDLRHEAGQWILADRGSGNGTLINSRIEDAPCMLASGDAIEVGKTAFRFDVVTPAIAAPGMPRDAAVRPGREEPPSDAGDGPSTVVEDPSDSREIPTPEVRAAPVAREAPADAARAVDPRGAGDGHDAALAIPRELPSFDGSLDDDLEQSTVSGKSMPNKAPVGSSAPVSRPKTLPPPSLARPRTVTGRPQPAFAGPRSQQMAAQSPAAALAPGTLLPPSLAQIPSLGQSTTTQPMPQIAGRAGLPVLDPSMQPSLPATLPGQGPPLPAGGRGPRLPFSYPSSPDLAPPRASAIMRAQAAQLAQAHVAPGLAPRDATSTALVQPISYGSAAAIAPQPVHRMMPEISRRTLVALGVLGLAVVAAIATIAIMRRAPGPARVDAKHALAPVAAPVPPVAAPVPPAATPPAGPRVSPPVQPPPVAPVAAPPTPGAGSNGAAGAGPGSGAGGVAPARPPATDKPATLAQSPTAPAVQPPRTLVGTSLSPPPSPPAAPAVAAPATPSGRPAAPAAKAPDPVRIETLTQTPAAATDKASTPANQPAALPKADRKVAKRPEPKRPERNDRPERSDRSDRNDRKVEVAAAAPRADHSEKKHAGRSMQDVIAEATSLYRSKNFAGAAQAISSALPGFTVEEARDLRGIQGTYTQLGKAYATGMSPSSKPIDAYQALCRALEFDRSLGNAYSAELKDKLAAVAPRAATAYMAAKSFEQALQAVHIAESLGSKSDNLKIVRSGLEDNARELLRVARSEMATDPDDARQKARQVQGMVEPKSQLYVQAGKLLNGP